MTIVSLIMCVFFKDFILLSHALRIMINRRMFKILLLSDLNKFYGCKKIYRSDSLIQFILIFKHDANMRHFLSYF